MTDADKYRARLEENPSDTQAFINLCDIAEHEGDYEYLSELYKYRAQVSETEEEKADMLHKAGEVFMDRLNDNERALEVFLQGFDAAPHHAAIGGRLDALYRQGEDWEKVLGIVEKRLDATKDSDADDATVIQSDLHQQAGEIYQRVMNDQGKALSHFRSAFELDKTNLLAIYSAREIYYALGKFKSAAKLCELEARGEQDKDRKIALYRELSHILTERLDDPKQGVIALKRALKLDSKSKEVKIELAGTIAATKLTDENEKDHKWASDYLLKQARTASGSDAVDIALKAFKAAPFNADARAVLLEKLEEETSPQKKMEIYQSMVDYVDNLEEQAPIIRKIATLTLEELGQPEEALDWLRRLEPLGLVEDAESIEKISQGLQARASQPPAMYEGMSQPEFAAPFDAPDAGLFGASEPAGPPVETTEEESESLVAKLSELRGISKEGLGLEEAFDSAFHEETFGIAGALAEAAAGLHPEDSLERLKEEAEESRLAGNEEQAELLMSQVLEKAPGDAKATTYLERRYRARGDFQALRDLMLKSASNEELSPSIRAVRLKEAANINEEELGDLESAIATWREIHELEPESREPLDALSRLLAQTENWEALLLVLEEEATTSRSKGKQVDAYRRMAEIHLIRLTNSEQAASAYNKVLELSPDDSKALEALDEIYLREQNHVQLVPLIKRRAEIARSKSEKRDLLLRAAIMIRERLGELEESYQLAIEILKLSSGDDKVLELMESIDEEAENWPRLVGVLALRAKAVSDSQSKAAFLRKKAELAQRKIGDTDMAVKAWNDVIALLPEDISALDSLAAIYRDSEQYEELVSVLQQRLEKVDDVEERITAFRDIASVMEYHLDNEEGAVPYWQEILNVREDEQALYALARWYEREENWEELAKTLVRLSPHIQDPLERADAMYRYSRLYEDRLDQKELAVDGYRQILNEVFPSHMETLIRLREILVENGEFAEAADLLQRQIEQTEVVDEVKGLLVLLGDWQSQELDQAQNAMAAYERAAQFDRSDTDLIDKLDNVYVALGQWEKLLKLIWSRFQEEESEQTQLELLLRGGLICEEKVKDEAKAWAWYRQVFDSLRHLEEAMPAIEEASERMGSWKELVDLYGILTRSDEDPENQAAWWTKIANVFHEYIKDSQQAFEAILRAFGLKPEALDLLDRVDHLAVEANAFDRLSNVYGVLVSRTEDKEEKIGLFTRYALVLKRVPEKASEAFDVILKAFELEPLNQEMLTQVEEFAAAAERYRDLVRVYHVCAKLEESIERKCELKLKAAATLRDQLGDSDGALIAVTDVLREDPFSIEIREQGWQEVRVLEEKLSETEQGIYWGKLVELYRILMGEVAGEKEQKVELLHVIASIQNKEMGDAHGAFECLAEAEQLNPKDENTRELINVVAADNGMWEDLAEHYRDMLDDAFEMEDAVMYHRLRAQVLSGHLDRADEASEHYWQIIQLNASEQSAYEALNEYYSQAEKWNDLVNILERRIDTVDDDETKKSILYQIASVWEEKIGNAYEARDWYEHILTLWPEDETALTNVERLKGGDQGVLDEETDFDEDIQSLMSLPVAKKKEVVEVEAPEELQREDDSTALLLDSLGDLAIEEDSAMAVLPEAEETPVVVVAEEEAAPAEESEEEPSEELEVIESLAPEQDAVEPVEEVLEKEQEDEFFGMHDALEEEESPKEEISGEEEAHEIIEGDIVQEVVAGQHESFLEEAPATIDSAEDELEMPFPEAEDTGMEDEPDTPLAISGEFMLAADDQVELEADTIPPQSPFADSPEATMDDGETAILDNPLVFDEISSSVASKAADEELTEEPQEQMSEADSLLGELTLGEEDAIALPKGFAQTTEDTAVDAEPLGMEIPQEAAAEEEEEIEDLDEEELEELDMEFLEEDED